MNKLREINRDYIGVIRQQDGEFKYEEVDIKQDYKLIDLLDSMVNDERFDLLDMYDVFDVFYPESKFKHKSYSYLCPLRYKTAYIRNVGYPSMLADEIYNKNIEDVKVRATDKYLNEEAVQNSLALLKQTNSVLYDMMMSDINEKIDKEVKSHILSYKEEFNYLRFVFAVNYFKTLNEILEDDTVKMVSTDQIGWKEPKFEFLPDIEISVKSNFGYGASSYFFCKVKYKEINILPYSDVVDYYYVQWSDFIRYTRRYLPCRDEWKEVFLFVTDMVNMAYKTPDEFIDRWIVKELDYMMSGLREIETNPQSSIERYRHNKLEEKPGRYRLVRNFDDADDLIYNVLPEEKTFALEVEKITGSLYLLDNLDGLAELSPKIAKYIEEIEDMNDRLEPHVNEAISKTNNIIDVLKVQLSDVLKSIKAKEKEMEPDIKAINLLLKTMNKGCKKGYETYGFISAEERYILLNKGKRASVYVKNKKLLKGLNDEKEKFEEDIRLRETYIQHLNKCIKRMEKFLTE